MFALLELYAELLCTRVLDYVQKLIQFSTHICRGAWSIPMCMHANKGGINADFRVNSKKCETVCIIYYCIIPKLEYAKMRSGLISNFACRLFGMKIIGTYYSCRMRNMGNWLNASPILGYD